MAVSSDLRRVAIGAWCVAGRQRGKRKEPALVMPAPEHSEARALAALLQVTAAHQSTDDQTSLLHRLQPIGNHAGPLPDLRPTGTELI